MNSNQVIWKYPLNDKRKNNECFSLLLPFDSEILCVQIDAKTGEPCIWVLLYERNADVPQERTFEIIGTGQAIANDMGVMRKYIGTFQEKVVWNFVWHLFERLN